MPVIEERIAFGNRIEKFIKDHNITQDELAMKCDLSRQTINNIINGKSNATSEFLGKMSRFYQELNMNWLISGTGRMILNENGETNYDYRQEYPHQSLIDLLDEKDKAFEALNIVIRTKEEVIESQKEIIKMLKG